MLAIITCSEDVTTDMLLPFLSEIEVFRFDINRWQEYAWDFSPSGFEVESECGQYFNSDILKQIYLRKPIFFSPLNIPAEGSFENWCRCEIERIWRDLYYEYCEKGKAVLVHPGNGKWYKPAQMRLAQKYFKVPEWHILMRSIPASLGNGDWVAKTLTQEKIGDNRMLFVKKVDVRKLNLNFPWFLQRKVDAEFDVTVLYVNGHLFAFELERALFDGEDCRMSLQNSRLWRKSELTALETKSVLSFMNDTGLSFGRLDFLRTGGELHFLELNPNGQWAWLDEKYENGVFQCVADEILKAYHAKK